MHSHDGESLEYFLNPWLRDAPEAWGPDDVSGFQDH